MGGKPSKGTRKDRRLKVNQPGKALFGGKRAPLFGAKKTTGKNP